MHIVHQQKVECQTQKNRKACKGERLSKADTPAGRLCV